MKDNFKDLAELAARIERSGEPKAAAMAWRRTAEHSNNEKNRDWCEARALFCESRFWLGIHL